VALAWQARCVRIGSKLLLVCAMAAVPLAVATMWPDRRNPDVVTIATWNLEWLVSPATAHAARLACRAGQRATLPCNVVEDVARDSADLSRLAAYARELNADIVAFQEVENEAIAARIFRGYRICMADGPGVQHVGFAVHPGLEHHCGPMVDSLALEGRSRKAMSMQLIPGRGDPIELLAVHLKSGCSRDPLDSDSAACRILRQQAAALGQWIAEHSATGGNFVVLGDFNRVPPEAAEDEFWLQLQTGPFEMLATKLEFSNCVAGQPFSAFIDHMLLGSSVADRVVENGARQVGYRSNDAVRYRLSDHCPVRVSLSLSGNRQDPQ
jgi:endonuclease/exonuclease/phosphatase family metal-dependent hydrolase